MAEEGNLETDKAGVLQRERWPR